MSWITYEDLKDRPCAHVTIDHLPLVVAGKGEVDLAASSSGCQAYPAPQKLTYSVVRGIGPYKHATGKGTIVFVRNTESPRELTVTFRGTIVVPRRSFDTTKPRIIGVKNLVVAATSAQGARVSFSTLHANDAVNGAVPVKCKPRSGALFPVGTTRVSCTATDTSGNVANAGFTVTVNNPG